MSKKQASEKIQQQMAAKRAKLKREQRNAILRICAPAVVAALVLMIGGCMSMVMPGNSHTGPLPAATAEEEQIAVRTREWVTHLAETIGERNYVSYNGLVKARDYLENEFRSFGYTVTRQDYTREANGKERVFSNLVAELPGTTTPKEIIVYGAHYDSVFTLDGCRAANDNASGVAAVLSAAQRLSQTPQPRTIRFVAFVNEEPPFFQTENMGSLVYARQCQQNDDSIVAMITPETIGYYDDTPGSQQYPTPLNAFYPSEGNFIAFVGNSSSMGMVRNCVRIFREQTAFPSEGAALPGFLTGVGWSDHWSFWQAGYPGLMVTDTAPFRYPHYHASEDTVDKIDFDRMSRVTLGLEKLLVALANE